MRKIIHVDMDAFYASVELRENPQLRGLPVVVAWDSPRSVICAASYEARQFGLRSAMSVARAKVLCPQAVYIAPHFDLYRAVSRQVRQIFEQYTSIIEPLSLDEAYLDVTENKLGLSSAIKIAKLIQYDIWNELHLTASAGVSYNKFLAKIASDMEKPHGLTLILPEEAVGILASLPIEKFHGVGKKTVKRLHDMGVYTGQDLLDVPEMVLIDTFGRFGFDLYRKARGISDSPVKADRVRKSIGKEKTYRKLLYRDEDVLKELTSLCQRVAGSLERNGKKGRTIVLKVRYGDFSTLTKRHSLDEYTDQLDIIEKEVRQLIEEIGQVEKGIRLLGVTVTNFQA